MVYKGGQLRSFILKFFQENKDTKEKEQKKEKKQKNDSKNQENRNQEKSEETQKEKKEEDRKQEIMSDYEEQKWLKDLESQKTNSLLKKCLATSRCIPRQANFGVSKICTPVILTVGFFLIGNSWTKV